MKRPLKIGLISLAVVAVLAVSLVVAVLVLTETDLLRKRVQEELEILTGRKVLLGAMRLSLSFPSLAHLTVEGFSIQTREGRQLFSADEVILSPKTAPLLRGELYVESVEITRFQTFVERDKEGKVQVPVLVVPVSSRAAVSGAPTVPDAAKVEPPPAQETRGTSPEKAPGRDLQWSIRQIRLKDGLVEWIDHQVLPGKRVTIPVGNITGTLTQAARSDPVRIDLEALVGNGKDERSPLKITGTAQPSSDYSSLARAQLSISSKCLRAEPFRPYFPRSATPLQQVSCGVISLKLNVQAGSRPVLSIRADLKRNPKEAKLIGTEAELVASKGFGVLEEARFKAESDGLPLTLLADVVPSQFPLEPTEGILKGRISGQWEENRGWKLQGSVGLDGARPRGRFSAIAKRVRVWAQGSLEPDTLKLDDLEISESVKLASVKGTIRGLSSGKTSLDLSVDLLSKPAWVHTLGLRMPHDLRADGSLPVHGRIRGTPSSLWLDMAADLSGISLAWSPHFEKPVGSKATLGLKGRLLPYGTKKAGGPLLNATTSLTVAGARLRIKPDGMWLSDALIHFDSKIWLRNGQAQLAESRLGIRRGSEAKEVLVAEADVLNLAASKQKIKGTATLILDRNTLAVAGMPKVPGLTVQGSSPLRVSFAGVPPSMDWSVDLSLTPLDIRKEGTFQKPGGVKGSFEASGRNHGKAFSLKSASLTLPGVTVLSKGDVTNPSGEFKELAVDIKKSDLKHVARFVPELARLGATGPITAAFQVKRARGKVIPIGSMDLLGITLRPRTGEWRLTDVKGNVEIAGETVKFNEIGGLLHSFVRGPIQLKGSLSPVGAVEKLNGNLSISIGKGTIRGKGFLKALNQAGPVIQAILGQIDSGERQFLDFDMLAGDFTLKSGTAQTDNLRFRGPRLQGGAMGKVTLASSHLDMLTAAHLVVRGTDAVARIPAVQRILKQHRGLLKATGLDKELRRFGITIPESKEQSSEPAKPVEVPVTIITTIRGSMGSPKVTPILEATLDKDTLARLKGLIHGSQ